MIYRHPHRRWDSWHRHVTCAMLALAFLTVQHARHPGPEPDTGPPESAEQAEHVGKVPHLEEGSVYR